MRNKGKSILFAGTVLACIAMVLGLALAITRLPCIYEVRLRTMANEASPLMSGVFAYRMDKGAWPESVGDLYPTYLSRPTTSSGKDAWNGWIYWTYSDEDGKATDQGFMLRKYTGHFRDVLTFSYEYGKWSWDFDDDSGAREMPHPLPFGLPTSIREKIHKIEGK